MGSSQSQQDDYCVLKKPQQLSLRRDNLFTYFWIDPKIHCGENRRYQMYLQQSLKIECVSSVRELEAKLDEVGRSERVKVISAASLLHHEYHQLQHDQRLESVVLFCRNEEGAQLLKNNFSKIVACKFNVEDLKDFLLSAEQAETRNSPNLLFMIEEDAQFLMQLRINFHALCCAQNREKAKNDYVMLLRQLYPHQSEEIDRFKSDYDLGLQDDGNHSQTLKWCFKSELYWSTLQLMPKVTTDPTILAYLRLQFKEVYEAIRDSYKHEVGEVYAVVTLTAHQIQKLSVNEGNFVAFPSFLKAYSNEAAAKLQFDESPNSFLLQIILPPLSEDNCIEAYDFGFCRAEQSETQFDILFNIYNFFQVKEFKPQSREIILCYGSLAKTVHKRKQNRVRLDPCEQNLMRSFDCWEDIVGGIDGQAEVLQIFGFFQESLSVYQRKYEDAPQPPAARQALTIKLGDAYKMNDKYPQASSKYRQVGPDSQHYLRALIHLADLQIRTAQGEDLKATIAKIQSAIQNSEWDKLEIFRAKNCIGLELMGRGEYRAANELFKQLIQETFRHYKFKYEGISLVHEININSAVCKAKLGDFSSACQLLHQTEQWQSICGVRKILSIIITEKLQNYIDKVKAATEEEARVDNRDALAIPLQLESQLVISVTSGTVRPLPEPESEDESSSQNQRQPQPPNYKESRIVVVDNSIRN